MKLFLRSNDFSLALKRWRQAIVIIGVALVLSLFCQQVFARDLLSVFKDANENDPEILGARARQLAVLETRPQALSQLLPQLNFSAGISRTRSELLSVLPGDQFTSRFRTVNPSYFNTTTYSVTLGQPLYHANYWTQLEQADKKIARAEAEYATVAQSLVVRVAERYFNVLAAEDDVIFAESEEKANQRQLDQSQQRFDVGLVAITDVHETRAARDLARARTIVARNSLISAQEALRELTGGEALALSRLVEDMKLNKPNPAEVSSWTEAALDQNLAIRAARLGLEIAKDDVRLRRSGYYPTLDLNLSHQYQDRKDPTFGSENQDTSIALQLNVPIYQGGAVGSRVRQARQGVEEARQTLEKQRRSVLRQARDAYLTVKASIDQVAALKQARTSAQSALDATEAGLKVGTRTTVDVLNARQAVFRARRDYERARYDYLLNSLKLKEAAGNLSIKDVQTMNRWFSHSEGHR